MFNLSSCTLVLLMLLFNAANTVAQLPPHAVNGLPQPGSQPISPAAYPSAAKHFAASFPKAMQERWVRRGRLLYVNFVKEGQPSTAVFSASGRMIYCISLVNAAGLPADTREQISRRYADYTIFSVKEITFGNTRLHYIFMQNRQHYLVLAAGAEGIDEIENISKQPNGQ